MNATEMMLQILTENKTRRDLILVYLATLEGALKDLSKKQKYYKQKRLELLAELEKEESK